MILGAFAIDDSRGEVLKNINEALHPTRVVLFHPYLCQGLVIRLNPDFAAFYPVTPCLQGLYDREGLTLLRRITLLRWRKLMAHVRDGPQGQRVQHGLRDRHD